MLVPHVLRALRAKIQSLNRTGFVRSVGVLVGGTAFAQALTIAVLPLLTRLYSPFDFSLLAVFASILSIISVVACLRLEIAIPLPESDEDAANLLVVALCLCSAIAAMTGFAVWWLPTQVASLLGQPALRPHLWLLPLGVWLASSYSAVQFWSTRKKRFGVIAKTRMTQSLGGAVIQSGLGWAQFAPLGLLFGQVVASGAGLLGLGREMLHEDRAVIRKSSWMGMRQMLRNYDRFPKYSTFEAFANAASIQLPVIIIAALSIGPEAGYLMLAMRAMAAPMSLIGSAVSQVYLSRAPEEFRLGSLPNFTLQIIGGLARSGVGPLIFFGIVSPVMFPLVFGDKWLRAGELVGWMTPWFVMQFLASPVSMSLHVTGNQRIALNLQIFGLVLRAGAVATAGLLLPTHIVEVYAASGFFFYAIYLYVVAVLSGIKDIDLFAILRTSFLGILIWATAGALVVGTSVLANISI